MTNYFLLCQLEFILFIKDLDRGIDWLPRLASDIEARRPNSHL